MPRIRGRKVYPGTLEERRILLGLGVQDIRVPRGMNPYMVARRLERCARQNPDLMFLSDVAAGKKPPRPQPEPDTPDIDPEHPIHVAGNGQA